MGVKGFLAGLIPPDKASKGSLGWVKPAQIFWSELNLPLIYLEKNLKRGASLRFLMNAERRLVVQNHFPILEMPYSAPWD